MTRRSSHVTWTSLCWSSWASLKLGTLAHHWGANGRIPSNHCRHRSVTVLSVDSNGGAHKDGLFLGRACSPIVWLTKVHGETVTDLEIVFNGGEIVQVPRFSNLKRAIGVFTRLVHSDSSTFSHSNDNHTGLLVRSGGVSWRSSRRVMRVLGNTHMGDVRLEELACLVDFGETGLDEPLLVGVVLFGEGVWGHCVSGNEDVWAKPEHPSGPNK